MVKTRNQSDFLATRLYNKAPIIPPTIGAIQKIQSWLIAAVSAKNATPVLRAGLTEVLVTGILIK